jgi:hypothetical protein
MAEDPTISAKKAWRLAGSDANAAKGWRWLAGVSVTISVIWMVASWWLNEAAYDTTSAQIDAWLVILAGAFLVFLPAIVTATIGLVLLATTTRSKRERIGSWIAAVTIIPGFLAVGFATLGPLLDGPEPAIVSLDATVVYRNPSTFTIQDGEFRDGEPVCVPNATQTSLYNDNEMVVTGFVFWRNPSTSRVTLQDGVVRDGGCVVDAQLPIPDYPSQQVVVGCESYSFRRATADRNWHVGTIEYFGCRGRLESPELWPAGLAAASNQLRRDTRGALESIGLQADLIEESRAAQPHPQILDLCGTVSIQDTDRESHRLEERQIAQLAQYWEAAGYDVRKSRVRVTASKAHVGTIHVSSRTIDAVDEPYVIEIATGCFRRDPSLTD